MTRPPFTPIVEALPPTVPFVGPEALERRDGHRFRARIGANESVFGPSPKAVDAMARAAAESWMYGDPEVHDLREAIATHHGVSPGNVMVGEGIDGLFGYTTRMFVEPRDAVATSAGAYPTFNFHVAGCGGRLVTVPYRDDREDPAALLDVAHREQSRLLFLANPDNPMGTWSSGTDIAKLVSALPSGCVLCLDEAYADFAPSEAIPVLDEAHPQVLRFRTFSKAHGMAGVRVGYVLGEESVIAGFDRIRNHFGVGRIAQAGALAALADGAFVADVVQRVEAAKARIEEIARANGLVALPSATNFVAVDCGRDGGYARAVLRELAARDVFVRMPGVAPLDRCIRVSTGLPSDLDVLEEALPGALAAALHNIAPVTG